MTIKQEIKGVGYEKLPTVALLAPKMLDFILSMKTMGFSGNAVRIVLILSANLKEKQMQLRKADKLKQLELFDNEWIDVDNDKAYSVQFSFKFSDFLPKGSKNYYLVRKGLDELQEKNYLIEFQKEAANGKIKKYHLKSALISSYLMEEGNGFKMIINNFWYRTLIDVTYSFNSYIKPIIFSLGSGSTIFYMYLKKLNFIKPHDIQFYESLIKEHSISGQPKGTRMKKETFKETFKLTYEYDSDLKRKVLDVWRSELNKFADLSFAYRIDDKYIYIITYEPTKNLIENNLIDIEEAKIRSALSYKMKNKNLGFAEVTFLLEIYLKYTYSVVFKATERKTVLKDMEGQSYVDMLLVLVERHVKENRIDISKIAYSSTKEMRTVIRKGFLPKEVLSKTNS